MERVFQLIVDNTSGVLSRISGLFSRRGYNIESITAGCSDRNEYTRITIVTTGDEEILAQIEKQVAKLEDVREIKVLEPEASVYRELALFKVKASSDDRQGLVALSDIFRAKICDVAADSVIIEITGNKQKIDAFNNLLADYEILEVARTGIAGLSRGTSDVVYL